MSGRFSVKLLAVVAALSLMGSGVAVADENPDVSGASSVDVSVPDETSDTPSAGVATTSAYAAPSVQFTQETSTDSSDPYIPPELSQDSYSMTRAVWEKDNRVRITNTTSYPYSAVVSISHGDSYWCSGSLVGKDVLLTAAHCVVDAQTGAVVTNMVFRPGADGANEPFGRATAKKIIIGPEFKRAYGAKYDPHDDWAVVKLSSTIGDKTGYFGFKADMPSGTILTLTGYPQDKLESVGLSMWSATGEVTTLGEYYMSHIDTYAMQSGSPLYDESRYVGAVNISDNSSFNRHERITPDIATVIRAMRNNTSVFVSSVKVTGSTSVKVGEQTVLTANVTPRVAENKSVSWKSSNTKIAAVDANGKVTGKKAGTVTITATAKDGSGKAGSLKVRVVQPVTKIAVSGPSSVKVGASRQLSASVSPSNASNKAVSWKSSNAKIATVDSKGKVTGKKAGTVTITATAKDGSGKVGSLKLRVVQPVTKVAVSGASKVAVGSSTTLKASVSPSDASNKAVSWKSSNAKIATVDSKGKVTGKKAGTVTITATAKDGSKKKSSKKVRVVQLVTKVAISGSSKVAVGSSTTLKASVKPSNASNKAVSWKSSNAKVATVDSKGKVTGKKAGTVTITATAKDGSKKSASKKVTVKFVKISKLAVSGSSSVQVGKTVTLKTSVSPSNASNKAMSWTSSNSKIATVNARGVVTGKRAGTVTITAVAKDGSKKKASKKITVVKPSSVQKMYRLYNRVSHEHLYTASVRERDVLRRGDWTYEGVGWVAPKKSKTPVYRLYNPSLGDHHYTTDKHEVRVLTKRHGWRNEGIGWYSDDKKRVKVYRQFNPRLRVGSHNYTANLREYRINNARHGWKGEGVAWYAVRLK